jgi:hypothetical protein
MVVGFLTANATPTVGGIEHAMVVGFKFLPITNNQ